MDFSVAPHVREECRNHGVHIPEGACFGVRFGHRTPARIAFEAPVRLQDGWFDIELIGAYTFLGGRDTILMHVGTIGRFCSIATNVQAGHVEHPPTFLSAHPIFHSRSNWSAEANAYLERNGGMVDRAGIQGGRWSEEKFGKIQIGNDVWIGEGVFIRRGVEIGDGAIIGARSVVTRDVPPYAIVGGAPAKIIRYRFEPDVIEELLRLQWWLYGFSALDGVDITDIDLALWRISENIRSGHAQPYQAPILSVGNDDVQVLRFDPETGALTG